jgi:chemotaxis protein CheD
MLKAGLPSELAGAGLAIEAPERLRYLLPGDVAVCSEPTRISTVLGSCVSVCLFDQRRRMGGMNHFVLPRSSADRTPSARFGPYAMRVLLDRMLHFGSQPRELVALVFGGACVLRSASPGSNHLGMQNARTALEFLAANHIPVLRQDAGGQRGRQVRFHTESGEAFVRPI